MEVHRWIHGHSIWPRCLEQLTENNNRVIGHITKDVEGRAAMVDNLPACKAILTKLHTAIIR